MTFVMNSQVTDQGSVTTMPDAQVDNDAEADAVNRAVLEKYDRESITRHITQGPVKYFIAGICILYSLFHLYITFNPMPALLQRSVHVGVGFALIFLIFPASKKAVANEWHGMTGFGLPCLYPVWVISSMNIKIS